MIITLANGKTLVINDIAKDPKAEGIKWLREYRESKEKSLGSPGLTPISPQERSYDVTDYTTE